MKSINGVLERIPRSGIRFILDEANRFDDTIHLEIGQPHFQTPSHIVEAAHQAALEGFTGYTPNAGLPSVREAFAQRLALDHHILCSPENVTVTAGAMGALFDAFGVLLSPGDEVLVPDPGYPNYSMTLEFLGAKPIPYCLGIDSGGFFIDPERVRQQITSQTKAILINSPSNPTGLVADEDSLRELSEIASAAGIYLISDECYDHIIFKGRHISPLMFAPPELTLAIYSCSKTYAMTGWRVGFIIASEKLCPLISKLQEAYVSCAPSVSQKAAQAALQGSQECVVEMNNAYHLNRNLALKLCDQLGLPSVQPSGAFYLMIKLPKSAQSNSLQFALELVQKQHLAVAPGITFGFQAGNYVRVALCTSQEILTRGLERLAKFYA